MATIGAAGAISFLAGLQAEAQNGKGGPRRIDIHHHFTPEAYTAYQAATGRGGGARGGGRGAVAGRGAGARGPAFGSAFAGWTLSEDLEDMDKNGTATAILSITTPGFPGGTAEEKRKAMRECNEAAAKLRQEHPGRFGSFAALPMLDTDGSLKEIEYAFETLKADGIGLFSDYGDVWLGNSRFAPIYEELDRRKAVVYIHPTAPNCCGNMPLTQEGVPNEGPMIEYGTDTTRTIASLIFSGTTKKFPNISFITSHAGGMMPYIIERFFQNGAAAEVVPGVVTKGQGGSTPDLQAGQDVLRELRKLYYDTAQSSNPVAMAALRKVVPATQIVFGTDYWYRTAEETARGLVTGKVFSDAELRMINRGNAERLLPKYKSS
jgi:predicted TIM-barrel fold metal-dependent hydrolase